MSPETDNPGEPLSFAYSTKAPLSNSFKDLKSS